jgi:cytochrome c biogenesis protein CcmG, thiol:disulfide interchange protein DsbE
MRRPTRTGVAPDSSVWRWASNRKALVGVVALGLLVAAGITAALTTSGSAVNALTATAPVPAPDFSLSTLSEPTRTVTSSTFSGKDLVLNFWASWCHPCQQEMPVLQTASEQMRSKVQFVGIDSNDTRGAALALLRAVRVAYPTLFDPNGQVAAAYGLFGLPTTVFVSPRGTELGRHSGQLDAATLQAALRQAFGPRVAAEAGPRFPG